MRTLLLTIAFAAACATTESKGRKLILDSSQTLVLCTPDVEAGSCSPGNNVFRVNDANHHEKPFFFPHSHHGENIIGVWYTPTDNVRAIGAFRFIDITTYDDQNLALYASGDRVNSMLRIRLHILIDGPRQAAVAPPAPAKQ